ncbi:hypothetical protein RirG_039890 [Rhizophagus irregularis DAOM 197198w]|uniref:GATA-type domain-containing protein n=1 Tax=Rhizophagus irregularis (strain DAOM 197198w) TaxID=1432141 RepID=A0A015N950_RHIIW|nr:hypothetical protein RirG_039890 [Rhizophagus irregularis DAOM 197198w]
MITFLPTPILVSIESNGLKAGDEIIVVYKTKFFLPAYLTALLALKPFDHFDVFHVKSYLSPSSTQLRESSNLLDNHYTYETRATLINDVDHHEIGCYLIIIDNFERICGQFYVKSLSGKLEKIKFLFSFFKKDTMIKTNFLPLKVVDDNPNPAVNPNITTTNRVKVKCTNCTIKKTPVWRFLEIGKVCNACYM